MTQRQHVSFLLGAIIGGAFAIAVILIVTYL